MACPPIPCLPHRQGVVRVRSDVRVELASGVLRYEVSETFLNQCGALGEADYIFPLPRNAAFRDLRLSINGELVAGETMSAERARSIYEEIVRRQRDPALVEWFDHGLLRTRIFPIAPGERKQVVVRFDVVAEREGDALRVDYFKGTEPRGGTPMLRVATARRVSDGDEEHEQQRPSETFQLRYRSDAPLGRAYSPTHSLRERRDGAWRVFQTSRSGSGITVLVPRVGSSRAAVSVLAHATGQDERYVLISLSPGESRTAPAKRDVAFVIDVSGSMRGEKMTQAIEAGESLLRTLRTTDHFRIIAFSTDADRFRDGSVPATRANLDAGIRYLRALRADGSTNIEAALNAALDGEPRGLPLVLFLTDGMPTVGERNHGELARMAAQRRDGARIFTFGIGVDVNVALLEQLAIDGRGTAQFVRPDESIERVVSIVAQRLGAPAITDLRLRADGVRLRQVYPQLPADVFAGQDMVILARYEGEGRGTIELTGNSSDGVVRFPVAAQFPSSERDNPFVARLWAIRRIGYLTAERRRSGASSEIDDEIRSLGERFGIPTALSSYLVLEPGMDSNLMAQNAPPTAGTTRRTTGNKALGIGDSRGAGVAAAAATPTATGSAAFESARTSAANREVQALSEVPAERSETVRSAANRMFVLRQGIWVDTRSAARNTRVVRVKPYSELYFALLREIPALGEVFGMGERVTVHGARVTLQLDESGTERLGSAEVEAIARDW